MSGFKKFDQAVEGVALEWVADNLADLGPANGLDMRGRFKGLDEHPAVELLLAEGSGFGDEQRWAEDHDVLDIAYEVRDYRLTPEERSAESRASSVTSYVPSFIDFKQTLTVRVARPSIPAPVTFTVTRLARVHQPWTSKMPQPPAGFPAEVAEAAWRQSLAEKDEQTEEESR